MSLEVLFWSVIIIGVLMIICSLVGIVWVTCSGVILDKGYGIAFAIMFALSLWSGFVLTRPYVSSVVSVAKQEYVETDATVVECIFRENPSRTEDRYKKLVIYIPETDEYHEIELVGTQKLDVQVGKTFRIKYYPSLMEASDPNARFVEFLYCVDDMNE